MRSSAYVGLKFGIVVLVAVLVPLLGRPVAQAAPQPQSPKPASKATDIVKQPLTDLNVLQADIPPILLSAAAAPYAPLGSDECDVLISEIEELDRALGPDLDLASVEDKSLSKTVSNLTFDLARGSVSGLIPFRGVVRRVTGADARARTINEALLAGTVRRSYLKGFGEMLGCQYPGSPRRIEQ